MSCTSAHTDHVCITQILVQVVQSFCLVCIGCHSDHSTTSSSERLIAIQACMYEEV